MITSLRISRLWRCGMAIHPSGSSRPASSTNGSTTQPQLRFVARAKVSSAGHWSSVLTTCSRIWQNNPHVSTSSFPVPPADLAQRECGRTPLPPQEQFSVRHIFLPSLRRRPIFTSRNSTTVYHPAIARPSYPLWGYGKRPDRTRSKFISKNGQTYTSAPSANRLVTNLLRSPRRLRRIRACRTTCTSWLFIGAS